jgi:tetratricopeptide (TPR) repeat protein
MKLSTLLLPFLAVFIIGCSKPSVDAKLLDQYSGRYLFNTDEIIEVYNEDGKLLFKWRGAEKIEPLIIDDHIFYIKEMNEKIQFNKNLENGKLYISLVPKDKDQKPNFDFKKLEKDERVPSGYLKNKEYDNATNAYLKIQKDDSLNLAISESHFNELGYSYLSKKDTKHALEIFKINISLYPESSNVYDSYAEALLKNDDTIMAIKNFNKSLSLDSGNQNAKRYLKKLVK